MPKDGDSAFQVARSIFNSDVWSGDPHMAKLWIYLLGKAIFKKTSPEQGMLTTSLRRIQQDNLYLDPGGIIKRFWSIHKIVNMLEELEKKERIECKGTPKGTLINIIKYRDYQDLSNYKGTPKGKQKGHRRDTGGTLTSQDSSNNNNSKTPKNAKNAKNVKEIIDLLNLIANRSYKYQSINTQRYIMARLNEGFVLDDFKLVIKDKTKNWGDDKKMKEYLRPETLFGTKMEGYLQDAKDNKNDNSDIDHLENLMEDK